MTLLALVGRPNVGKSSIFNRLAGKQLAIVHDTPGVTRDYKIATVSLGGYEFQVMDTAGLEQEDQSDLVSKKMQDKTLQAALKADIMLFVINGQEGITPIDEDMAKQIRQWNKPVVLLVNKADTKKSEQTAMESFSLGFGNPVLISAAHNIGFDDLLEAIRPFLPEEDEIEDEDATDDSAEFNAEEGDRDEAIAKEDEIVVEEDTTLPIKVAIVGRPNAGKSTLLNAIIGEERSITSPVAGTTRDSVHVHWEFEGRHFRLVDTAGLRKKYKIVDPLEKMSAFESHRAIRLAHVVILVLDAEIALDHQDQAIADHVIQEGRALVIAINKWDTVKDPNEYIKELRDRLDHSISQVKDVPYVTLTALNGKGVPRLLETVISTYQTWQRRLSTSKLNRWLAGIENHNPPPMASGRANRLRYATQIKSKPPTFAIWVSRPDDMPDSYARYLMNNLRETFDLPGIPLRLYFRRSKNPYADK